MDKKAQLTIIGAAIILLSVVTITYGFFVSGVNNDNPQTATITTGTMELTFADNDAGIAKQMIFGESIEKKFTLENTGTVDAHAFLYWKDLVNTYLEGSLVYKLEYSETATGTKKEILKERNVPSSTSLEQLSNKITVPSEKTYYYTLTITLVNSETVDQTADINASFATGFDIKVDGEDFEDANNYPTISFSEVTSQLGELIVYYPLIFVDYANTEIISNAAYTYDISAEQNGSVIAYEDVNQGLTIAGNGSGKINIPQELIEHELEMGNDLSTHQGYELLNIVDSDVEIGTFTVYIPDEDSEVQYNFEVGMTWREWAASDYKTDNKITVDPNIDVEGGVYTTDYMSILEVAPSDIITNNGYYYA